MKYKLLSVLSMAFLSACSSTPKNEPVTLSCYAEQTHDFIEKQGGKNYWTDMVTEKTLKSCRQFGYKKHVISLTQEEIQQANEWITKRELKL